MSFPGLNLIVLIGLTQLTQFAAANDKNWLGPEFSVLQKVYDDCQNKDDFTGCLKSKALVAITKAIDQDSIRVVDGVSLEKQNSTTKESILGSTDARTLNDLSALDRALIGKLDKFLRTHTVKVDMSEGRKKDDKKMQKYIVAALLTAMGIAGPIGLKALAAIAGKALVISKVALTIASIIALKKIFSSDHHEETSFQVHSGEHNRRNALLVRPMKSYPTPADPYRYYYEYATTH